jgi:hypothetical protein
MMMMVQLQPFFWSLQANEWKQNSTCIEGRRVGRKKMMMMLVLGDGYLPGLRKFCLLVFV